MKALFNLFVLLVSISLMSCEEDFIDNIPPAMPTNIFTDTGDELVIIEWSPVLSRDLAGYAVYYSYSYDGEYKLLGTTNELSYIDYGATNGDTYYYAVASYDYNGNESELSEDVAYDTPRPEGFNQYVYDFRNFPNISGYDFSMYSIDEYNSDDTDFFFDNDNGVFYLDVWSDTDIQNMGRTNSIYDISYAPNDGWVELLPGDNIKYVRAIPENTYVIWTNDNHYAKIRISEVYEDHIEFDWAYQTAYDNVELKTSRGMGESEVRGDVIVNRNK